TKRFVRDIDFFLSFFSLLTVLLAVLFAAVLADHWLFTDGLSMSLRVGVFFVLLFIIAFHVYRRIVPLLLYPINPVYVASLLEESRPSLKNSIVNWILLRKERLEQENHYNSKLAERIFDGVAKTAVSGVKGISSERAVDLRGLTRWGIALTLCFLFFVAYATFSPKSPLTSLTRIILPISNIERPQAVRFLNIEPGNTVALQGEKLTVSAEVVGQSNEPVYLFFSTDDGQAVRQAIPMSLPEGKTRYEVLFPPGKQGFAGNVDYWIAQNDSRSGTFRIEVRPTASVEIVSLKYRFPPYTGLPDETLENSGDIRAIEGTEVKIGVRSTIPLQRIDLVFDNDPVKTVGMKLSDVNPLEATAAITLKLDPQNSNPTTIRNFSFRAIDQEGYESRRSGIFRLEVLPDQPPMVQWADTNTQLKDVAQLDLPLNSSLELPIQAEDRDFGLRYLRFHVESGNKQIRPAELLESPATGPTEYKGSIQRKAVFSPITSRLAEGDSAEIWAEAVDTKFPDPNNATTRRITVRIVAPQKQEQPPKENEKNSDDNKEKQNKEQDTEQNKEKSSDKNNDKEQNKNNEKEQQETKQQEQEKNQGSQDSTDNREQNGRSNDKRYEKSENNKGEEEEDNNGEENNKENGKEQNKEKNSGNNGENDERQKSEETQNGWNEGEQSKESDTQGNSNEPSREPSNTNENTSGNNNDKTEDNKDSVKNSAKDLTKNDDGKENSEQENENPSSKDDRQNGVSKKAINPETQDGDAMEEILKQMKKEGKFDDKKLDEQTGNKQNANNEQTNNDQKDNNQNRSQQENNDQSSKQADSNQTEPKQADSTPDSKPEPRDQNEQNPDKQGSDKQGESGLGQENSQPKEANQTDTKNSEQTNANNKEQSSGQKDNSKGENSSDQRGDQQSNDSASEFSKKQGNDRKSGDQAQDVPVDSADNAPRQRDDSLDPNSKERSNQGGNSDNPQKSDANTPSNSASGSDEGKTQTGQQKQSNQQTQSAEQSKTVDKNENGIEKQNGSQEKGAENKQAGDNQNGNNRNGEKQNSATKNDQSDKNESGAGQSKELNSDESGNSNESGSDQSNFNQSDLPKGENSAAGKNQKNQSGKPSPDSTSNTSPTGGQGSSALNIETLPEDANLEYTKKITNLVLEYLEDQLKTKPNQELLDNLGWTEKDLRDFHRKWQEMSEQSKHPEPNTSNDDAQWKEAFKSLGLKPGQDRQQLQKSRTEVQDKNKVTESQRFTPPSTIKDRFKRYTEGIGK
ncbi:MAG: hypothetical protein LBK82_13515, partial [Planctomycetaceae bacterium]|nr:hypothetical protein [Planctomycetaceae bacterium]